MTKKLIMFFLLTICSRAFGLGTLLWQAMSGHGINAVFIIPAEAAVIFCTVGYLILLHFYITPKDLNIGTRSRIMYGGRTVLLLAWNNILIQIPLSFLTAWLYKKAELPVWAVITDTAVCFISLFLLAFNGAIRILCTSKHLRLVKRLILLFTMWIPPINIIMAYYCCHVVKNEYLHDCNKTELQNIRADSKICATKYPLVLLHGIGFRDYKYINYWGRIPKYLISNGATLYYGHQQAWGTIEKNAEQIKQNILNILENTSCEKVNIIAHSKGGLDARYLISSLDMAPFVASLTTISTPHRGSEVLTELNKLSDKVYRGVANIIDGRFRRLGDTDPDCCTSSRQLLPDFCAKFNKKNPDAEGVYYQSYAAVMKNASSDSLLTIPYAVMKWTAGDNDGLVKVESAVWGNFKGVISSGKRRGISHGDLIDLKREDIKGFDITEKYIEIVCDLKKMGF